jgi:hypothetical protein
LGQVSNTHTRSFVPQSSIIIDSVTSSYGEGGGLEGSLVDIPVTFALAYKAGERTAKLRQEVGDFDFRSIYWASISNVLSETAWLKVRTVEFVPDRRSPFTKAEVSSNSAVNIEVFYRLSPDTRVLSVETWLEVFLPGKHRRPAAAVRMDYQSAQIGKEEGNKALALWMADHGAAYRKAAREGIEESARMLARALNLMGGSGPAPLREGILTVQLANARGDFGIVEGDEIVGGALLDESEDRLTFLSDRGVLLSVPRSAERFSEGNSRSFAMQRFLFGQLVPPPK